MIEGQIRRPCKQPPLEVFGVIKRCPDCQASAWNKAGFEVEHQPVVQWLPLAEAVRLAHIEEAEVVGGKHA